MKIKLLSTLLIITMILCGCSAPASEQLHSSVPPVADVSGTDSTSGVNPDVPIQHTVYLGSFLSDSGDSANESLKGLKSASDLDLYNLGLFVEKIPNTQDSITLTFGGKTHRAEYAFTKQSNYAESDLEELRQLGTVIRYQTNDNEVIDISQVTGDLVSYLDFKDHGNEGNLTESEAIEIGRTLFVELFGESMVQQYTQTSIRLSYSSGDSRYWVYFNRIICGYETSDRFSVAVDLNGVVTNVGAKQLGCMETAAQKITAEMLDSAENVLGEYIPDHWEIETKELMINADGVCYLYCAARGPEEEHDADHCNLIELYVNVN